MRPMKIIDLTWRLPGPLGTYFLARQGAEVIKFEDVNHRDPFLTWDWDPSFARIYEAFQGPKEVRLIEFGDAEHVRALHEEIRTSDAVVMGLPPRVEAKLGLTHEQVAENFAGVSFTRLGFRPGEESSAHDLNTLAHSKLLRMHILDREDAVIAPPFLPATGIFFSYHIALSVLNTIVAQQPEEPPIQNWCYLQDAVDQVQQAYYPESIQDRHPATFLHNGRFPCYNIYRTADGGHLAVAAVEPKFWSRFREITGLDELSDDDGLSHDDRAADVKRIIAARIGERTTGEWAAAFDGVDACVDVLESV